MEFKISRYIFSVDKSHENYNRVRVMFDKLASSEQAHFQELYTSQNRNLDDLIHNSAEQYLQCLQPAITQSIKILVENDILDYDEGRFLDEYGTYIIDKWQNTYDNIEKQYAEIVLTEEQMDQYRVARRESRGRVVGGGFGLSGAIKGMATAGALNAAAGATHMIFNGIGKIGSSIKSNSKKKRIFTNPQTLESLKNAVFESIFACHYAVITCLIKRGHSNNYAIISPEDEKQADIALSNVLSITDDKTKFINKLFHIWKKNPYNARWYRVWMDFFGDADRALETMEKFFGIDIHTMKAELIEKEFTSYSIQTEEKALEAQKRLTEYAAHLGTGTSYPSFQKIQSVLSDFDLKARTVDGIVCDTREEAEQAKTEYRKIMIVLNQTDKTNINALDSAIRQLNECTSKISTQYIDELKTIRKNLDISQRQVDLKFGDVPPVLFETAEQADAARAQVEDICHALSGIELWQPEALAIVSEMNIFPEIMSNFVKICKEEEERHRRTFMGYVYETRKEKNAVEAEFQRIRTKLSMHPDEKECSEIQAQLHSVNFPDEAREYITQELNKIEEANQAALQARLAPELKKRGKVDTITGLILLCCIIAAFFVKISAKSDFSDKSVQVLGQELLIPRHQTVQDLGIVDGLKNGILVLGETVIVCVAEGITVFLEGFRYHLIGNIVWLLLGWIWVIVKCIIVAVGRYFVTAFYVGMQSASLGYYLSYIISLLFPWAISAISSHFGTEGMSNNQKPK